MNAYEIVKMTEQGMSPLEAIRSATTVAAELVGVEKLGEIKEGWHADIIAVDADPLQDITSLLSVTFVMKAGTVMKNSGDE
jgi:imidazolonepropionase-like amidohydrolase